MVADQRYFGLEARALRAGAGRVLARMAAQGPEQARIDVRSLGSDFHLDAAASGPLLQALLAGGLLHPDGTGGYRPSERLREYALACVVAPLLRARAKRLIDTACELAARINADWARNPFQIKTLAVSGSYMSRRDQLPELSLWVVLRPRPKARTRRSKPSLNKSDGLREILMAVNAVSSFIVVRIVADRQAVQRPFSVVFQASEDMIDSSVPAWDRVRDWSASITRRLASR
ncbi:MAG TPA: hypothetical protein VN326_01960 [Casimicrobiaceae bacterium]|nr:hypothetical protein [Casimicrobiaceae bacterium]